MAATNIEWADRYWNPVINRPKGKDWAAWPGNVAQAPEHMLTAALRWRKPCRIFVNSMGDLFHESVPAEWIDKVFAVMALAPQHTFIVLTKRAKRMRGWFAERWQGTPAQEIAGFKIPAGGETGRRRQVEEQCEPFLEQMGLADTENDDLWTAEGKCKAMQWNWPLPNVHLGVSCEDQARADERIPDLLETPAAVRFASAEPLLGPINFRHRLDWIICGGESGPGARPMHVEWARSIREQCAAAGVPFFMKQLGSHVIQGGKRLTLRDRKGADMSEWPHDLMVREFPR